MNSLSTCIWWYLLGLWNVRTSQTWQSRTFVPIPSPSHLAFWRTFLALQPSERTSHFLSVDVQGYQSIRLRNFPVGHNSLAIFWILDKWIIIYTLNYKPFEFPFLNCQATIMIIMQSMLHAITNSFHAQVKKKRKTEFQLHCTHHQANAFVHFAPLDFSKLPSHLYCFGGTLFSWRVDTIHPYWWRNTGAHSTPRTPIIWIKWTYLHTINIIYN